MKGIFVVGLLLFLAACQREGQTDGLGTDTKNDSAATSVSSDGSDSDSGTGNTPMDTSDSRLPIGFDTASQAIATDSTEMQSSDDGDTASNTDSSTSNTTITCPEGTQMHTTASGKVVCCNGLYPVFCDENDAGYSGSCWPEEVNCDSITLCSDSWHACKTGSLPYCDASGNMICFPCDNDASVYYTLSGMPVCCDEPSPLFCDENAGGFPGGCWASQIDCSTIIWCENHWGACAAGNAAVCQNGLVVCQ
ncbi:MAG: hypothetical protein JXR76_31705 [Deltaproteobacteria bacterium]|nr:hypothetical protein [Deltaproteobacteria bacterium]